MKETIKKGKEVMTPKKEEVVVPTAAAFDPSLPENKQRHLR